jgi:phosphopentomutase
VSRAFLLVMDSLGVGGAPDAGRFDEEGADTLRHIVEHAAPSLPNLMRLGLGHVAQASTGQPWPEALPPSAPSAAFGVLQEKSRGKDTPSGHWELAGVPIEFDWGYFPRTEPCFPGALIDDLMREGGLPGVLGNRHASGTVIIEELGAEHARSGKPIVYTSADSVFQIAAHEKHFGLDRLYALCESARALVDDYNIGRVIARPFIGEPGNFERTGNRRDYATPPPAPTLLDRLEADGGQVTSIGKVADIFAHRGTGRVIKAHGNDALWEATLEVAAAPGERDLIITNFVDFDTLYGHRRDVAGYASALERFDAVLPAFEQIMRAGDIAVLSADHGCDPTWPGSDHTRENVPLLAFGPGVRAADLGVRDTFADVGQTFASHLNLSALPAGRSFLADLKD